MKQVDERDVMFSRMGYKQGTKQYEEYYNRNPEKKKVDDELRQKLDSKSAFFHPQNSPIIDSTFKFLGDIKNFSDADNICLEKITVDAKTITGKIKGLAKFYNAKLVGITETQKYHYYSHRGRHLENYGQKIEKHHKYGIVFAVEMDKNMINRAPQLSESIAVTKGYVESAVIGMIISYYIRELGYEARNHMDGNYLLVAPLIAQDAGLGELGRNGLLVTKEYGSRIRLGIVTTDMPLECDSKNSFGLVEFCSICALCSKTCPGRCISNEEQGLYNGTMGWKIDSEACYNRWKMLGTDCGVCIASCPFSDGLAEEDVKSIKASNKNISKILDNHKAKYGIRPFIKGDADWLK